MPVQVSLEALEAERRDFQLVQDAITTIQGATLEQLRDLEWIERVICSVGLGILHPPEVIYADKGHLVNASHQGVTQYPLEFARWLRLLADFPVRTYMELGCYNGGTACLATAYLHRFNPELRAITAALDIRALYAPKVDRACGVEEPAVDQWEAAQLYPSWEQVEAPARLTGTTARSPADFCASAAGVAAAATPCRMCAGRASFPKWWSRRLRGARRRSQ